MNKLDKLYIYSSTSLSSDDYFTLNLLYQPLIGSQALGIYLTFSSLSMANKFKKLELFRYCVCDLFHIDEEVLVQNITKLEGIGLVNTFKDSDGSYLYELLSPLTPRSFIEDSMFGVYLLNGVGESMYNFIVEQFKIDKIDKSLVTNITSGFESVYNTTINIEQTSNFDLMGGIVNKGVMVKNHDFDFSSFLAQIDESTINISNDVFKDIILKTAYVYEFDEGDMVSLFRQSYNNLAKFDENLMKKKAALLFKVKNNNQTPSLGVKKVSSEESELIKYLGKISIKELLDKYWPNYPNYYLSRVENIYSEIDYAKDILNLMIFYVLKEKNGELPSLTYFKKVCESWKQNGVVSVEDAYFYIKSLKKKVKVKKQNIKSNKWVDELTDSISERFEKL